MAVIDEERALRPAPQTEQQEIEDDHMGQLTTSQQAPQVAGAAPSSNAASTFAQLEYLVDQAAVFNTFILANQNSPTDIFGLTTNHPLHRFSAAEEIAGQCLKASNAIGEAAGTIQQRLVLVPDDYVAAPRRNPPQIALNPDISQRFVMQEMRVSFGDGRDGFIGFGTGRTFPPMHVYGRHHRLAVSGVGDILQGFGKFNGHSGNFVLSGDLVPGRGFEGNLLIRVVDPYGKLRTTNRLPPVLPVAATPDTTYLMLRSRKRGPEQRSTFSYSANGQIRGINVPLELKQLTTGFGVLGTDGLVSEISTGAVIGKEVGFTATNPANPGSGNGSSEAPFSFQGVSRYTFFDRSERPVGSFTVNFLEGRTFLMKLAEDPSQRALRFAFYGPIIFGTGCFKGVRGMFYGASGSVFEPPPGPHVIIHTYMARLDDPDGRFRVFTN